MEQNEARQLKMAEEQNAEKVFVDKASGKNTNRAAFKEMMAFVRAGDTVCGRKNSVRSGDFATSRSLNRGRDYSERAAPRNSAAKIFRCDRKISRQNY